MRDLPGCFSVGDGVEDALQSAKEAIEMHIEGLLDDGRDLPETQSLSTHQASGQFANGVWAVVDVPVEKS